MILGAGGAGGKGGGSEGHTPVEAPNTLRSKQYLRQLHLLGWGPIQGLHAGLRSIMLDGTPLQNPDGTFNFQGVQVRRNTGTISQTYLDGFSQSESEQGVGVRLFKDNPVVRSIADVEVEKVRITLSVPDLKQLAANNDLVGAQAIFKIEYNNNGGGWLEAPIKQNYDRAKMTTDNKMLIASARVAFDLEWVGPSVVIGAGGTFDSTVKTAVLELQRRPVAGGAWTVVQQYNLSGRASVSVVNRTQRIYKPAGIRATEYYSVPNGTYQFQFVKISGEGTAIVHDGAVLTSSGIADIAGKTNSKYQRSYEFALPAPGPWDIRVTRLTADSTSSKIQDLLFWDTYTEIIDEKFRYPRNALVGIEFDAEHFSTQPVVSFDVNQRLIKVPSNYNPVTRTYTGTWNGSFVTKYSTNPAWCFYDILTEPLYGLGEFIPAANVSGLKWQLYVIGQYCDEEVPDGMGGTEPRFEMNFYTNTQEEAYTMLNALASVFRGMTYWAAGTINTIQDAPADPVIQYTHANVIDGKFTYEGSSSKVRHTVALVTYNDKDTGENRVKYVEDAEAVIKYGIVETNVAAVGCTSEGQAERFGRAILYSERLEDEVVNFATGLDSAYVYPGAIIETADRNRLGVDAAGRVLHATSSVLTLDRDLAGSGTLKVMMPDGTTETMAVAGGGNTVNHSFIQTPQKDAIWMLSIAGKVPEKWRVLSIAESGANIEISAVTYNDTKYASIEGDVFIAPNIIYRPDALPPEQVKNIKLISSLYISAPGVVSVKGTLSWEGNAHRYVVGIKSPSGQLSTISSFESSADINPLPDGTYDFYVTSISEAGRRSAPVKLTVVSKAKSSPPGPVENLRFNYENGQAILSYDRAVDLDVLVTGHIEVRHSPTETDWEKALPLATAPGNTTQLITYAKDGNYIARWVDSPGGSKSLTSKIISTTGTFVLTKNVVETLNVNAGTVGNGMTKTAGEVLTSTANTGYWESGVIDLGSVLACRVDSVIDAYMFDSNDLIGDRGPISTWSSITGIVLTGGRVFVQISTTQTDPSGSPVWTPFSEFSLGTYSARGFRFRLWFELEDGIVVVVNSANMVLDMPDRVYSGQDVVSQSSPMTITYPKPFYVVPSVGIMGQNLSPGEFYKVTNKTKAGFDIEFRNSVTNIIRTYDWMARAY